MKASGMKNVALVWCILAGLSAAACSPPVAAGSALDTPYVFRDDNRPTYEKTLAPNDLANFVAKGGMVLDVRLAEDLAADPATIPGAERRDPEQIVEWAKALPKDRAVAVYCVKGKWVSQKAAAYLAEHGVDAYSVEGGIEAWKEKTPK